jgi:hypothetical protein
VLHPHGVGEFDRISDGKEFGLLGLREGAGVACFAQMAISSPQIIGKTDADFAE